MSYKETIEDKIKLFISLAAYVQWTWTLFTEQRCKFKILHLLNILKYNMNIFNDKTMIFITGIDRELKYLLIDTKYMILMKIGFDCLVACDGTILYYTYSM